MALVQLNAQLYRSYTASRWPQRAVGQDWGTRSYACSLGHLENVQQQNIGSAWNTGEIRYSFPSSSPSKLQRLVMRGVTGEEGKKGQGQKISQTLTQNLFTQLISIATLVPVHTTSSADLAKVTECIWCSFRLETRTWQDNHNTWWMILDEMQNLNVFLL